LPPQDASRNAASGVDDGAIARGIASTVWPGRLEAHDGQLKFISTEIIILQGAREIAVFWQTHLPGRNIYIVYGA